MKTELIKIAIADDHALMRKGIADVISGENDLSVIIQACNGKELVEAIESSLLQPDVCIIDVSMPVMDGYVTASTIRKQWPDIKILALSMHDHEYSVIKMLKNGACGYLLKSDDPAELVAGIRAAHAKGSFYTQLVGSRLLDTVTTKSEKFSLTDREIEFLRLCCRDISYGEIAGAMQLSTRTIEGYRDALFRKLQVNSRVGLVVFTMRCGLITPDAN